MKEEVVKRIILDLAKLIAACRRCTTDSSLELSKFFLADDGTVKVADFVARLLVLTSVLASSQIFVSASEFIATKHRSLVDLISDPWLCLRSALCLLSTK
ncbi:hypothetical protein RND81_12G146600 [Saponaria officinalis]|uniref:Uncharacterized protein n=1 Tax=Saponaria officinalis TaxID=3572 RepID=A0AAW1HAP3_SAPOF